MGMPEGGGSLNPAIYLILFLPLLLIYFQEERNKKAAARQVAVSRKKGEKSQMEELAKRFIGKECLIYTLNSQITGTVREISGGAVLVETKDSMEAVNLDYIIRIREYPIGKNGKKKSLVCD